MKIMGFGAPSVGQVEKQLMKLRAELYAENPQLYELKLSNEPQYNVIINTVEVIYIMAIESLKNVLTLQKKKGADPKYDDWKKRLESVMKELASILMKAGAQDIKDKMEQKKRAGIKGLPA